MQDDSCVEVTQALVVAGYLSDADVEAAAAVLSDALAIADTEDAKAAAATDAALAVAEEWMHRR